MVYKLFNSAQHAQTVSQLTLDVHALSFKFIIIVSAAMALFFGSNRIS